MHMKKNSNLNFYLVFLLVFVPLMLLFVTPEPYYKIVLNFGTYSALLGLCFLYFPGIKRIIQERHDLSPKATIESIDEIKNREKERSRRVLFCGILIIIIYILYIFGII